jgi:hypothetical protein
MRPRWRCASSKPEAASESRARARSRSSARRAGSISITTAPSATDSPSSATIAVTSPGTCAATSARCFARIWPAAATRSSTSRTSTGASTTAWAGLWASELRILQPLAASATASRAAPVRFIARPRAEIPRSIASSAGRRPLAPRVIRPGHAQRHHAVQHGPERLERRLGVARARSVGQRLVDQPPRGFGRGQELGRLAARRGDQCVVARVLEPELEIGAGELAQILRRVGAPRDPAQPRVQVGAALLEQRVDQPRLVAEVVVDGRRLEARALFHAADGELVRAQLEQE